MAMGNPTIQDIERWDATKLAKWIQQVLDPPLHYDDEKMIIQQGINGRVFLRSAGNRDFFRRDVLASHLGPVSTSRSWPKVSPVQLSRVSYYLSYHIQSIRPP